MANDVNKIIAIGRLGADAEMRYTPNGQPVTNFRFAVNREYRRSDDEKVKETTWYRAAVWGKYAEALTPYLTKGKQVFVEGRPVAKAYQNQDGEIVAYIEITVDQLQLLGGGNGQNHDTALSEEEETIPF